MISMALPIIVLTVKTEKQAVPVIIDMSILLGTIMGFAGHFFHIYFYNKT